MIDYKYFEGLGEEIIDRAIDTMTKDLIELHRKFRIKWKEERLCECKHNGLEANCKHVNVELKKMFKKEKNNLWNATMLSFQESGKDVFNIGKKMMLHKSKQ